MEEGSGSGGVSDGGPGSARPRRVGLALLAIAAAGVLIFGGVTTWNSYWHAMRFIIPGLGDVPSTSMEPYELVLRTRLKNRKPIPEDAAPLEWRLRVPRAFFRSEIGQPEAV